MATTRGRLVQINQVIFDQADYFQADGFTRVTGLLPGDLDLKVYYNNILQPWLLVDGSTVLDSQVSSGKVYFHEIPGSGGEYSVRFRPNALGYWRVLLSYTAGTQTMAQDYDVIESATSGPSGIKSSFVKVC